MSLEEDGAPEETQDQRGHKDCTDSNRAVASKLLSLRQQR